MMRMNEAEKNKNHCLNRERKQNGPNSCDVALISRGIKHYAHKSVLISCSLYFRGYFEETTEISSASEKCPGKHEESHVVIASSKSHDSKSVNGRCQTTIPLPGISPGVLNPVLEYMYTSELMLTAGNVTEILLVGCFLQITSLIEHCADILLKHPTWKSPLVSPKLWNFTKRRTHTACAGEATASSPICGGSAPLRDIQTPSRRERTARAGAECLTGSDFVRQHPIFQSCGPEAQNSLRKRRHANFPTPEDRSRIPNEDRRRKENYRAAGSASITKNRFSVDAQQQYPMPINFVEVNRELARNVQLMWSRPNRFAAEGFPLHLYPNTLNFSSYQPLPSLVLDQRGIPVPAQKVTKHAKASISSASLGSGQRDEYNVSKYSLAGRPNLPTSIFPTIGEYSRIWPALYASAIGLPTFPSGYSSIPAAGLPYRQRAAESLGRKVETDKDILSNPNGYSASVSAIFLGPSTIQDHDASRFFPSLLTSSKVRSTGCRQTCTDDLLMSRTVRKEGGKRDGTRGAEVALGVSYKPRFKRFCPDVIQHQRSTPGEEIDFDAQNPIDIPKLLTSTHATARDRTNLAYAPRHQSDRVDYHQRKRKLLSAVPDLARVERANESEILVSCKASFEKIPRDINNQSQGSSEDNAIAPKCYRVDGSDHDSDDSGRHSSV